LTDARTTGISNRRRKALWVLAATLLAGALAGGWAWLRYGASQPAPRIAAMVGALRPTTMGWSAHVTEIARGFADPYGVALDRKGNVYVADGGESNVIVRITPQGGVSVLAGGREGYADATGAAAAFHTPSGMAIDRAGNLYVADTGNNAIRKVTPAGVVSTVAGGSGAGFADGQGKAALFNGPLAVAVDKAGNLYVADTYNDRIRRISPDGMVSTLAGGEAPGFADGPGALARFDTPSALVLDKAGNLYVADTVNGAVRKLAVDGTVSTIAQTDPEAKEPLMRRPVALAITHDGFLYIGDMARGRILQWSPQGELRALTGVGVDIAVGDAGPMRIGRAAGLALDSAGALLVADAPRRVLRKVAARKAAPSAVAVVAPAPAPATMVPWPFAPQDARHEVVGVIGEVRGSYDGESRHHFHNGLDVQADMGVPVLAVANEKVTSPVPNSDIGGTGESIGIDSFAYVHLRVGRTVRDAPIDPERFAILHDEKGKPARVRVKRGQRFRIGDPLGTVNRMFHVHLIHRAASGVSNPLALPFPNMVDTIAPRINAIELHDAAGQRLLKKDAQRLLVARDGGPLAIVVDAFDMADGNAARRRLGLYKAGYQVLGADGVPLPGFATPVVNIEFNQLPPDDESVKIAYADKSGITVYGSAATRFLYVVTNRTRDGAAAAGSWNPAALAPGDYTIRIFAADYAGNEALAGRDLDITVR